MTREEFIGKLQMVYVGDKNASADIISEFDRLNTLLQGTTHCYDEEEHQKLKNIVVYAKVEVDRLNETIAAFEEYIIDEERKCNSKILDNSTSEEEKAKCKVYKNIYNGISNKFKKIKEGKIICQTKN